MGCLSSCFYGCQRQQASVQIVKVVSLILYSTLHLKQIYIGLSSRLVHSLPPWSTLYPARSSCTSFDTPRIENVFTVIITLSISSAAVRTGCPKRNYLSATDSVRTSVASTVLPYNTRDTTAPLPRPAMRITPKGRCNFPSFARWQVQLASSLRRHIHTILEKQSADVTPRAGVLYRGVTSGCVTSGITLVEPLLKKALQTTAIITAKSLPTRGTSRF